VCLLLERRTLAPERSLFYLQEAAIPASLPRGTAVAHLSAEAPPRDGQSQEKPAMSSAALAVSMG
jgi:hypothetical protein